LSNEVELVSDGDSLAVIGDSADVERFLSTTGLTTAPSKALDLHRISSLMGTAGAASRVGADVAANSGRWVKLTAESAAAVKKYGLMPTKTPGVSHAMVGQPGDIKQWLQIASTRTALLSGPMALTALSTMMQQRAMQQQMDEIVEYLQEINEKIDDILRNQKEAVLADLIGVDLIIEDALTVRDEVGRVSETTWSKVQGTALTIARTQAYALKQLEAIAERLEKKADLGAIAKATKSAEPQVREWLAVIARTFHLQDGLWVLELDRVLDQSPDEIESHRAGLNAARRNRGELIALRTQLLLTQMGATINRANSNVLFKPFDAPAAVRSSNSLAAGVIDFRSRIGIESAQDPTEMKRWGQAAIELRDRVVATASDGATTAARIGAQSYDRAAGMLRKLDTGGDGLPDKRRVMTVAEDASAKIKGTATGVAGALGSRLRHAGGESIASIDNTPELMPKSDAPTLLRKAGRPESDRSQGDSN